MAAVVVSPYSSDWPGNFLEAREVLLRALAPCAVEVEHVGSTSVPGLAAKPVLDILVGVTALPAIESRISAMASTGYEYVQKYEQQLPDRRYFVRSSGPMREHVHAVVIGSSFWFEHLAFRDMLRSNSALRSTYQALKLELATRYSLDKSAYQAEKGPFIRSALATARVR